MMFGNQIHSLHWNRSKGWILDRAPPGTVDRHISVSIGGETRTSRRGDHPDSPFRVFGEIRSPSAKSTFNGNENSLNYATAKFMSNAERDNKRGGYDFISWRVMRVRELQNFLTTCRCKKDIKIKYCSIYINIIIFFVFN